jgi:hypothetical protein
MSTERKRKFVVLTVTERCNLDCVYCFEKAKTSAVMDKLHEVVGRLSAEHPKDELECAGPIENSGICKPCKGGCGSLTQILSIVPDEAPVYSTE